MSRRVIRMLRHLDSSACALSSFSSKPRESFVEVSSGWDYGVFMTTTNMHRFVCHPPAFISLVIFFVWEMHIVRLPA